MRQVKQNASEHFQNKINNVFNDALQLCTIPDLTFTPLTLNS